MAYSESLARNPSGVRRKSWHHREEDVRRRRVPAPRQHVRGRLADLADRPARPGQADGGLKEPNVVEFDITGRPMKGWVMVEAEGIETDEQLSGWIERAVEFVETLPRK